MQGERAQSVAARPRATLSLSEPPAWLLVALGIVYVAALAVVTLLPGGTLLDRLRALDGGICAQLPTHSFFFDGQQLPLCSRNTGIYSGFAATLLVIWATGRQRASRLPGKWVAIVLGLAVLAMAVDGFNSLFLDLGLPHLYQPHNLLRLITGLGTGTAMAAFIVPVTNSVMWQDEDGRSTFGSLRDVALMLPVLLMVFLADSSEVAVLLYPIAVLSSVGLILALTCINMVLALSFSPVAGRFTRWRQVLVLFSGAVVLAVVELMGLFALKSSLMAVLLTHR